MKTHMHEEIVTTYHEMNSSRIFILPLRKLASKLRLF